MFDPDEGCTGLFYTTSVARALQSTKCTETHTPRSLFHIKTTLMSGAQTSDLSTLTSEHKHFTDIRRTEPFDQIHINCVLCACVAFSLKKNVTTGITRLQFLRFLNTTPVLHFHGYP